MNWGSNIFITLCFALSIIVAYALWYFRFDQNGIEERYRKILKHLSTNDELEALLNGSDINNIPGLNIISTNPTITMANNCGKGPVRIGDLGTDADCIRVCANSSAKVLNINPDDTYTYDSTILTPGAHCILGKRPECNPRTTITMMTINSVTCRSKFPRAFGGPLGNKIVACNNAKFYDPKNVFWDAVENKPVDVKEGLLYTEDLDERYGHENQYRFICKFNGTDVNENPFIPHPHDRLQPMRNYCASLVYNAHSDVKTVFSKDGQSYTCDCGAKEETRVSNLYQGDLTSPCSDKSTSVEKVLMKAEVEEGIPKHKYLLTLAYPCFTLYSPMSDAGRLFPCPPAQFTERGSTMGSVSIPFTLVENELIEHPSYEKFSSNGSLDDLFGKRIV